MPTGALLVVSRAVASQAVGGARRGRAPGVEEQLGLHGEALQVVRAVVLEQDRQVGVGRRLVEGVGAGTGRPSTLQLGT